MAGGEWDWLDGAATEVAPRLLGKVLVAGECSGRIVETEAYCSDDPASHSFRGVTPRTEVMFGRSGVLYVYFVYGMHWCANVVAGVDGSGQAALIRALEPMDGVALMVQRRGDRKPLTDGPAKLCQALAITGELNGLDLTNPSSAVSLLDDGFDGGEIHASERIGISVAKEKLWRYRFAAAISDPKSS